MPIPTIPQPDILPIDDGLRLRASTGEGDGDFALPWYQDLELVRLVDGDDATPYPPERLALMYRILSERGELYFIELREGNAWVPVGDVTLMPDDLPIVIATAYQRRGIGRRVVRRLIERGRELGFDTLGVREIFLHNTGSQRLFTSCGFVKAGETELGASYVRDLKGTR